MPADARLRECAILNLQGLQLRDRGPVMIKIRLQATNVMGLNANRLSFGKDALHGKIGDCDQDNADQRNQSNSGNRFGHGMYTPCPAKRDGAKALINLFA
jgi:hypothetical protein